MCNNATPRPFLVFINCLMGSKLLFENCHKFIGLWVKNILWNSNQASPLVFFEKEIDK